MRSVKRLRNFSCLVIGVAAAAGCTLASVAPSAAKSANSVPIYLNPAYPPGERAADLVSRMTTAEKAAEMDSSEAPAIPRLGVAAWGWWNEANHGVSYLTLTPTGNAKQLYNTTTYPTDLALGSTWNPGLVHTEALQIGAEAREVAPDNTENLDFYAPTVNLSRDPRWGRNDETWSEDPTLTADLASQYVDGLQGENSNGQLPPSAHGYYQALATLKHYAANNTEDSRLTGSSNMDQAALREYYTKQFADIIAQSHPASMMSAYNEVNGIPSPANVQLNQELARETYGFGGYFTSDCDAVYVMQAFHNWIPPNSTVPVNQYTRSAYANSAGEDLECNAGYQDSNNYGNTIPTALTQNIQTLTDTYNIGDVDTSLVRLFTARIETGEFDAEAQVPWVAKARAALSEIRVRFEGQGSGEAELTWGQAGIWRASQRNGKTMNLVWPVPLAEGTPLAEIVTMLRFMVSRHPALRTRLRFAAGPSGERHPRQVIAESGEVPLHIVDIGDGEDPGAAAEELRSRYELSWFDYENEFPVRMGVIRQSAMLKQLVVGYSHVMVDGGGLEALDQEEKPGQDHRGAHRAARGAEPAGTGAEAGRSRRATAQRASRAVLGRSAGPAARLATPRAG
jgi:beta-glucosidase-like glycosyl hydrolase